MKRIYTIEIDLEEVSLEGPPGEPKIVEDLLQGLCSHIRQDGVLTERSLHVNSNKVGRARVAKRSK